MDGSMKGQRNKTFKDLLLSGLGTAFMTAVLQLVVYKVIESRVGSDGLGCVQFFTALALLLAGTFGSAANYGRLKVQTEEKHTENGDWNLFLLGAGLLTAILCTIFIFVKGNTEGATAVGIIGFSIATVIRTYGDVQFRLNLKFQHYSLYYIIIGLGYLLGLLLFLWTGHWVLVFLTGECAGLAFAFFTGTVFRKPFFRKSDRFGKHLKLFSTLSVSYILSDFVSLADKLLIPFLTVNGDEMASRYYFASLIGRTMSLLSTPLNGVLSGHLTNREGKITTKTFTKVILLMLGAFILVTAAATPVSHLFVTLWYPEEYEAVKPLFLLANAGQVMFFICNTLMVIVLRYTPEKNQFFVNSLYIVLFLALAIPLTVLYGVNGMAWAILIANIVKFLLYFLFGFASIRKAEKEGVALEAKA